MIKANELRIGNYAIYRSNEDHIVHITTIGGKTCQNQFFVNLDKAGNRHIPDEQLTPIPLTPEILGKCGFAFTPHLSYKGIRLSLVFSSWTPQNGLQLGSPFGTTIIKSIHQLQNWFYAVTGEELEVKL
jgi:hypothetical protein